MSQTGKSNRTSGIPVVGIIHRHLLQQMSVDYTNDWYTGSTIGFAGLGHTLNSSLTNSISSGSTPPSSSSSSGSSSSFSSGSSGGGFSGGGGGGGGGGGW